MSSSQILSSSSDPLAAMFDVPCAVEFILGTATIKVRDCIRLEAHSIVRLTQSAGADLEVRVHGCTIASGEVVIVDDNTALRISHITPPPGAEAQS